MGHTFVHTADWHLGKKFFRHSRIEEQKLYLEWLENYLRQNNVNALIIAGDVFDVPNPSSVAQNLYYEFLKEISSIKDLKTYIISGNHDSSLFIEAPKGLLKVHNVYVSGKLSNKIEDHCHIYEANGERTGLFLFPYFRAHDIIKVSADYLNDKDQYKLEDDPGRLILDTIKSITAQAYEYFEKKSVSNKFAVAHHLFHGFELAGSELGLSLSGLESLPKSLFDNWDYLALGHIHAHQCLKKESPQIYYSGSPLQFRSSESQKKSILKIQIEADKLVTTREMIPMNRKILKYSIDGEFIEADFEAYLEEKKSALSNFYEITLDIPHPDHALKDRIIEMVKEHGDEIIGVRLSQERENESLAEKEVPASLNFSNPLSIFKSYYDFKYAKDEMPKELLEDFNTIVELSHRSNESDDRQGDEYETQTP